MVNNKADLFKDKLQGLYFSKDIVGQGVPMIGISGNFRNNDCTLASGYFLSVLEAGGTPIIIPPYSNEKSLASIVDRLDGIVLSGGADIDPIYLGEDPLDCVEVNEHRDEPELMLVRLAVDRNIPILGICRGIQILSAALGGKLYQDIVSQHNRKCIEHNQSAPRGITSHSVELKEGSILSELYKTNTLQVNSFHHQAVKAVPEGFTVTAVAPDGIIEGMESTRYKSIIGVQWHPECMILDGNRTMMPVFDWLVGESVSFMKAKSLHERMIVLDSHCDTPMFFDKGARFYQRNPQIDVEYDYVGEVSKDGSKTFKYDPLVDLHKMVEGHLDVSFMVAYLHQYERDAASLASATEKADRLLSLIEDRIAECSPNVKIAYSPEEILENKFNNVKSVVLGIENGYAVGLDIKNIERFRNRGVAYMTLCHNGDNDICDSAKGNSSHNGISAFGSQVIEEMNRVGMMIDLSHGSEKSFYDAVSMSSKPIICSHSSSRALCNHPRNLTDDQLKALSAKNGVAQVCLYSGFLKKDADATIVDAIAHIMHMIDVAGIDHVGIGSDFDGGGGLIGLEDASVLINITRRLMSEGLNEVQISQIWGDNFIRVWKSILEK